MSNPGYNFNIFNLINNRYGSQVMKLARNLEKKSINIQKQKQHLTFNHELKRAKILPPSLRFNPPINCYEGRKISTKAGWGFMRLRISHGHRRIKILEQIRLECKQKLISILPQEHWDMLDNAIKHNTRRVKEFVQTRHAHKLAKLGAANNEYVNKDRWVVNLSSRKLTSAETTVLQYGLNFAPAPKEIPIPKIVASIESGIRDLPESNKESVRATVTNILKYSKPPTTCNLSRQQKLA